MQDFCSSVECNLIDIFEDLFRIKKIAKLKEDFDLTSQSISIKEILLSIRASFSEFINSGDLIAVGVSGGQDSVSLSIALQEIGVPIVALIVNHNLRKTSHTEAIQAKDILESRGIDCFVLEWIHSPISSNIENEARDARYELLIKKCKELNIKFLCLGHHLDDQAETVLLNLSRGSGLVGLCGMMNATKRERINIIRPMLNISKQKIVEFIEKQQIEWVLDPSNSDLKIKRNALREIISQISEDKDNLNHKIALTAQCMQSSAKDLKNYYDGKICCNAIKQFNGEKQDFFISSMEYCSVSMAERISLLSNVILSLSKKVYRDKVSKIKSILNQIENKEDGSLEFSDCKITWDIKGLHICKSKNAS